MHNFTKKKVYISIFLGKNLIDSISVVRFTSLVVDMHGAMWTWHYISEIRLKNTQSRKISFSG